MYYSIKNKIICVPTLGQSLGTGQAGSPAISTATLQNAKMLSSANLATATLVPLVATATETIDFAMGHAFEAFSRTWVPAIISINSAVGGLGYPQHKKGTSYWNVGLAQLRRVVELAWLTGQKVVVPFINFVSGETDHINWLNQGDVSGYTAMMQEFWVDLNTDYKAITNQSEDIKIIFCQTNAAPFYPLWAANPYIPNVPTTALVQLQLSIDQPDKFVMAGPKYHLPLPNDREVHLSNRGYQIHGEKRSQVALSLLRGESWNPIRPIKCEQINNTQVKIDFSVPVAPLVFDTSLVSDPGNKGFEFVGTNKNDAQILNVAIFEQKSVILTFNKTPLAKGRSIAYAYSNYWVEPSPLAVIQANPSTWPRNVGPTNGARGCLRDSDPYPSLYGYDHRNHCVQFIEPIR
jgi:hypothetical protein